MTPVQVSAGLEHRWEHFSTFAADPEAYITGTYPAASGAQAASTAETAVIATEKLSS